MSRPPSSRFLVTMAVFLAYFVLLTWSGFALVGSAAKRPLFVLCSAVEEMCQKWAADFQELTGIPAATTRLSTWDALARLSRPESWGEFDVWHAASADALTVAQSRGILLAHQSPEARRVLSPYKDPDGWWTGTSLGVLCFCSNERVLEQRGVGLPRTWDDLTHSQLAGLVSIPNAIQSGTGYTIAWSQVLRLGSKDAALDYLSRLDGNVLQYTKSGLASARTAGRGEAAIAVTFSDYCIQAHDEGLDDLKVTFPLSGTSYEVQAVALLAGAQDRASAQRYVDYAVSRRGQGTTAGSVPALLPTRPDLVPDPRLRGSAVLLSYETRDAAQARAPLTARIATEVYR